VALRLTQSLRAGDTSARLAEDQFALLMEDLDSPEQAERAATRVLESLVAPLEFDTQEHLLSPCIGFAIYPTDADSVRALFEAADLALLMAKREGDIALRRYASDFRAQVQQRSQLEHALHKALAGEQFMLHFQPCLTLSGEIVGVEALLRWQHPTLGPIAPDRFIPILEQNGQITGVGLWVLDQALAALKAWDSAGLTVPWLSLNVSSVQLLKPDIAERFIEALERHQISGTRLVLELTESVVMRNAADAISKLKAMTEHGIRIAVDDFGTGYSSLAYLKRLPIHHLKIDKEFVLEIDHDVDDQAIVRSILALAQALNLEVIAEGVETRAQWQKLADLGCSIAQGFYLGRPQCGADFLTYLRTPRSGLNH
jgi:diguanylate cyclase